MWGRGETPAAVLGKRVRGVGRHRTRRHSLRSWADVRLPCVEPVHAPAFLPSSLCPDRSAGLGGRPVERSRPVEKKKTKKKKQKKKKRKKGKRGKKEKRGSALHRTNAAPEDSSGTLISTFRLICSQGYARRRPRPADPRGSELISAGIPPTAVSLHFNRPCNQTAYLRGIENQHRPPARSSAPRPWRGATGSRCGRSRPSRSSSC